MKTQHKLKAIIKTTLLVATSLFVFTHCSKEEEENESESTEKVYTINVGVFILNGSTYEDQNKDLIFDTQESCQSWSRTAKDSIHSLSPHDHFNAAKNTTYDLTAETIRWTEYGPELDQSSIDATCGNGNDGAAKSANKSSYTADKNFYLKIKSVIEK
jgi:hypothetical protein